MYERETTSANNQRTGKDMGQVITARPGYGACIGNTRRGFARHLAHRKGLTGQERFIEDQVFRRKERGICRYPVALGNHQDVVANDFPSGYVHSVAVTNHEGPRAREIAQGLQDSLAT